MFIAGGLLILGVLALIALVLVIRSEPTRETSTPMPPPVPMAQEEAPTAPVVDETLNAIQFPPEPDRETQPIMEDLPANEWHPSTHRQFQELVNELRSVHEQAQNLEHRLSTLLQKAEQTDYVQEDHISEEENRTHTTEIPTTLL